MNKANWCPLIQDFCREGGKGGCVCYEMKGKVDYSKPNKLSQRPFCNCFMLFLPGEPEDEGEEKPANC